MLILAKQLRFYVKNVVARILNKPSYLEKRQDSLPDNRNPPLSQSRSLNVPNVTTSTQNSSQRKFNPLTDSHMGTHDYLNK